MSLSDRQSEIVTALRSRQAPQLADMFEAAVELLGQEDLPCLANLVAHAAREISNGLPRYLDLPIPSRVEYAHALDIVSQHWTDVVSQQDPASTEDAEAGLPPPRVDLTVEVRMPAQLIETLDALVGQHRRSREWSRRRRLELAVRELDSARREEAAEVKAPGPEAALVNRWHQINRWFESAVHLRKDGKARPATEECRGRFAELEDVLFALLAPHFTVSGEINDLLEDANS